MKLSGLQLDTAEGQAPSWRDHWRIDKLGRNVHPFVFNALLTLNNQPPFRTVRNFYFTESLPRSVDSRRFYKGPLGENSEWVVQPSAAAVLQAKPSIDTPKGYLVAWRISSQTAAYKREA